MSHQEAMIFGVEFEFIITQATDIDSHPRDPRLYLTKDHDPSRGEAVRLIVDCLKDLVPVVEDDDLDTSLDAAQERGIIPQPNAALPYSYIWRAGFKGSLEERPEEDVVGNYGHWQHPVEVSSRVLYEHEFDEVAQVYRQLRASLRINLNSSCSVHVHVGTAHFDLIGYKKLATIIMVCEPFLWRC